MTEKRKLLLTSALFLLMTVGVLTYSNINYQCVITFATP